MRVFIIGIAGGTGARVARELHSKGDQVSGLYRDPKQIDQIHGLGAMGVLGDVATISDQRLATAIHGMDVIVFCAGAGEHDDETMIDKIDEGGVVKSIRAARKAGVPKFLLVSVFPEAGRERDFGEEFEHYISAKKKADKALVRSGLEWLIVRPSALENTPGTGKVSLSPAELHEAISRDDLAQTIVHLLHTPWAHHSILEATAGDVVIADAIVQLRRFVGKEEQ